MPYREFFFIGHINYEMNLEKIKLITLACYDKLCENRRVEYKKRNK